VLSKKDAKFVAGRHMIKTGDWVNWAPRSMDKNESDILFRTIRERKAIGPFYVIRTRSFRKGDAVHGLVQVTWRGVPLEISKGNLNWPAYWFEKDE